MKYYVAYSFTDGELHMGVGYCKMSSTSDKLTYDVIEGFIKWLTDDVKEKGIDANITILNVIKLEEES